MGGATPGQVVVRGYKKADWASHGKQASKQCSSLVLALVPALSSCPDFPTLAVFKLYSEINFLPQIDFGRNVYSQQ